MTLKLLTRVILIKQLSNNGSKILTSLYSICCALAVYLMWRQGVVLNTWHQQITVG